MTESLASHLNDTRADDARIEHAVRYLVAQWAEHKPPEEMNQDLLDAGVEPSNLEEALAALSNSAELLDTAALEVLNVAWNDPELHDVTVESIQEAGQRLPVVELAVISVSVLYGIWLATTGGRKQTTRTVRHHADGTYEETETTEWYDPAGPLSTIVDLLHAPGTIDRPRAPELPAPGPESGDDEE